MNDLTERLAVAIRDRGPITFAAFMDAALYDPTSGFFSHAPVGREFVTSPHISPVFSELLAGQFEEVSRELGSRTVVDLGAGDGTLSRALAARFELLCIERSDAARAQLKPCPSVASIEDVEPFAGVVIANELFDNVPFHRIRGRAGLAREIFVGFDGDRFVEIESDPTVLSVAPPDGGETTVSPMAADIVCALAKKLKRGYVFVFDYGFVAGEEPEPVRSYAAHRAFDDVLGAPGTKDITGPVDFDALASAARTAGLEVFGPVTQREALHAIGYRETLDRLRARQHDNERAGEWRAAIDAFGARGDASMLVDPRGLGSLKVIAFATQGLPCPRALQSRPSLT